MQHNEWFYPRGSLIRGGFELVVDDSIAGWHHTGLRVAALGESSPTAQEMITLSAAAIERVFVPLTGSFEIEHDEGTAALAGRASVFAGPSDVLYLGTGIAATIRGNGRIAVAEALSDVPKAASYIARENVPVELRGAGRDSRQVHNFGTPEILDATSLIVCEVITPAGNWSSHPAHKHDEYVPDHESQLEEIYYFEAKLTDSIPLPPSARPDPFGNFITTSSTVGEISTAVTVRTGDVALVPFGYHGPAAAAPEYDLYYLNVMAGPASERVWLVSDEPEQAWIRESWLGMTIDPRLPYAPIPRP